MLFASAPTLFPTYHCSPSVCADVHATVKSKLEEGDVDGLVRSRFAPTDGNKLQTQPLTTGSRLLRQVAEVIALTGEPDPLNAMSSMLREVKELREVREKVLETTRQLSVDGALDVIEVAMRDRNELRSAEEALGEKLGSDGGWRAVAAEVEAGRHLEQRVRAFAGVASGTSTSTEAALRTMQHREKERLSLLQLRNDVLAVAAQAGEGGTSSTSSTAAALAAHGRVKPPPPDKGTLEPSKAAVKAVSRTTCRPPPLRAAASSAAPSAPRGRARASHACSRQCARDVLPLPRTER